MVRLKYCSVNVKETPVPRHVLPHTDASAETETQRHFCSETPGKYLTDEVMSLTAKSNESGQKFFLYLVSTFLKTD